MESIWVTGKTFLEINFLRLIHPEIHLQRIQSDDVQRNREAAPEAGKDEDSSHK